MARVFLSHSTQDKEFVEQLAVRLQEAGLDVWYDKWEIKIGDSIAERINDGITRADFLVVVLSKNSVKSKWVRREIDAALAADIEGKGAFILPVLVEKCPVPPLLSGKRYASFHDSPDKAFQELLEALTARGDIAAGGRGSRSSPVVPSLEVNVFQLRTTVTGSDHTMYEGEPEHGLSSVEEQCESRLGSICAVLMNDLDVEPSQFLRESRSFHQKIGYPGGSLTTNISRASDDWLGWEGELVAEFNYAADALRAARLFAHVVEVGEWDVVRYFVRATIDDLAVAGRLRQRGFRISKFLPKPSSRYEITLPSWTIQKRSGLSDHRITPTFSIAQLSPSRLQLEVEFFGGLPRKESWPHGNPWASLRPEAILGLFGNAFSKPA